MAVAQTSKEFGYTPVKTMEEVLNYVASNTGNRWKDLGRHLSGISESDIENIDDENPMNKEKAIKIVYKWYRSFGQSDTCIAVLADACDKSGNKLIGDEIRKYDVQEYKNMKEKPDLPEDATTTKVHGLKGHIESWDESLSAMLKENRDGLETCDSASVCHRLQMLKRLQNMEEIISKMIDDFKPTVQDTNTLMWTNDMEKKHRKRKKQTSEMINFSIQVILPQSKETNSTRKGQCRPISDIPKHSSTWFGELPPRSRTVPGKSEISSPIHTSKTEGITKNNLKECSE